MNNFIVDINNQSRSSEINKKIFVYCLENGHTTIPQISKALNFSVPTVTKHVNELCSNGYFADYGKIESKEGRPANIYGTNPNSCYFIGVDLSIVHFSIAIVNLVGDVIDIYTNTDFVLSDTEETIDETCSNILAFIDKVYSEKKIQSPSNIINININISGRVNSETGFSYSMFNTGPKPLTHVFSEKLGYNVSIENDSRAKTYGEYHAMRNLKPSMMLCINIDMGTAMGVVIDGKVMSGKSGFAGEFGHTHIYDNEIICHCGKKGCFETEVSGRALKREIIKEIKEGNQSVLSEKVLAGKDITIYEILDAINSSEDMLCIDILESIGMKLGLQVANLINIFNPDVVVISGLLSTTGDFLLNPVNMAIKKHSIMLVSNDTKIMSSNSKYESGVIGACLIARNRALDIHQ